MLDSCPWAACYRAVKEEDGHHCTQFRYNRDADSGGRYIKAVLVTIPMEVSSCISILLFLDNVKKY